MPLLSGERRTLKVLVARLASEIGWHGGITQRLGRSDVGLELNRVNATFACRIDQLLCIAKAAIMNRSNFVNDKY